VNPHDPDGVDVLRGLARQPNREMALAVAEVLQNVLGLDLGLPPNEFLAANSKQAASPHIIEVTPRRRNAVWLSSRSLPCCSPWQPIWSSKTRRQQSPRGAQSV